jgi:thiol-disulfide isomerase/thioredoxin
MTTSQVTVRSLAALVLVAGFATAGRAQPTAVTAEWALKQNPRQPGVSVSTPTPDQVPRCKVTPLSNPKVPGYLVTDGDGKPVRQFVSYDNKNFNIISFYTDGVESYREVYPPQPGEAYQFRWLGPNGSKWGLDRNRDGVIDDWGVISPEEVSQELLKAVIARDAKRLEALLITPDQLKALGLPAADVERMRARAAGAAKRLIDAAEALKLSDKAKWIHCELGVPNTRPKDSFEGNEDYTAYKGGTILVEDGGKTSFLQTGELVQIGRAWKVVDGPAAGAASNDQASGTPVEPGIAALVEKLNDLDKRAPNPPTIQSLAAFNAERARILEGIAATATAKEPWVKMLIDAHASAAEGGKAGNPHLVRLQQWKEAALRPESNNPVIASYAAFRLLMAENSVAMADATDERLAAVQEKLRTGLEDYLKAFGQSADAPEAALRLAMAFELAGGKDMTEVRANEAKARHWYDHLAKNFAAHPNAAKAHGALKRFDCEGKPLELVGPQLGTGQVFNAAQKDKVVIVYYWASWSGALVEDAKKLDALVKTYGPKGLTVVTVGLDHDPKAAVEAAGRAGLPGTHLYEKGGLDSSPLAAAYGIMAPPHVLLAGKDGKISNRNAHIASIEEEVKRLLEK